MRSDRQLGGVTRRPAAPASNPVRAKLKLFLTMQAMVLTLLGNGFMLAAPAQASSHDGPEEVSVSFHASQVAIAEDHPAVLLGEELIRGRLPFARLDLAILVLGGAVITVAAAGAPLLLRPLRHTPPVLHTVGTASPLLPAREQGSPAHAQA